MIPHCWTQVSEAQANEMNESSVHVGQGEPVSVLLASYAWMTLDDACLPLCRLRAARGINPVIAQTQPYAPPYSLRCVDTGRAKRLTGRCSGMVTRHAWSIHHLLVPLLGTWVQIRGFCASAKPSRKARAAVMLQRQSFCVSTQAWWVGMAKARQMSTRSVKPSLGGLRRTTMMRLPCEGWPFALDRRRKVTACILMRSCRSGGSSSSCLLLVLNCIAFHVLPPAQCASMMFCTQGSEDTSSFTSDAEESTDDEHGPAMLKPAFIPKAERKVCTTMNAVIRENVGSHGHSRCVTVACCHRFNHADA